MTTDHDQALYTDVLSRKKPGARAVQQRPAELREPNVSNVGNLDRYTTVVLGDSHAACGHFFC